MPYNYGIKTKLHCAESIFRPTFSFENDDAGALKAGYVLSAKVKVSISPDQNFAHETRPSMGYFAVCFQVCQ